jgi:hypothetical protein
VFFADPSQLAAGAPLFEFDGDAFGGAEVGVGVGDLDGRDAVSRITG